MTVRGDDSLGGASAAERCFAEWAARVDAGEAADFEELVRAHEEHADELRRMEADRRRFAAILSRLVPGLMASEQALALPPIHLGDPLEAGAADEDDAELLERLRVHLPAKGRYRFRRKLGAGGGGIVIEVWDERLGRRLAMKLALGRELALTTGTPRLDGARLARFVDEARIGSQLDHPSIVPVHEVGTDERGQAFFTMKLVEGEDLSRVLEQVRANRAGWSATRALRVLVRVCEAMAYAHEKGVVHRDLKPHNVRVGRHGEVHVMDWGLARVLGEAERCDLRPHVSRGGVDSLRREGSGSPFVSVNGTVVGTPAYMPPEQARGEVEAIDARADVYAIGAMLYELLAGAPPYVPRGESADAARVLARTAETPPEPLARVAPRAPAELAAICERAMAREPGRRYPSAQALGEDLAAFLDGRVVRAYRTGAWAEARKWFQRNRALGVALAAAVLAVAGGAVAFAVQAEKARSETTRAENLAAELKLALSSSIDLEDLEAGTERLWPPDPQMLTAYEAWLEEVGRLLGDADDYGLPGLAAHEEKLARLRASSSRETDRAALDLARAHPAADLLARKRAERNWHARMLGLDDWPEPDDEVTATRGNGPLDEAWKLLDPSAPAHGQEWRALALAMQAAEGADPSDPRPQAVLAWAFFRVGEFEEALALAEQTEALPGAAMDSQASSLAELRAAVDDWEPDVHEARRSELSLLDAEIVDLEIVVGERRLGSLEDTWWHSRLMTLIQSAGELKAGVAGDGIGIPFGWGVQRRLAYAREIEERSARGAEARARWDDAIAAIARSPNYRGLALEPQLGLLPIGADPDSGLWEFAHLMSGEPAARGGDGRLVLTEATGIVLVFLPGGRATLGGQRSDPSQQNYDPQADDAHEGPVDVIELRPFFLSKYEMTQAQWLRIAGENPSRFQPPGGLTPSLLHPVESVSWHDARTMLFRLGLSLPGDAQWEYACRAGTDTPWWTGREESSLYDKVNLADASAADIGGSWGSTHWTDVRDGWPIHAPIGRFPANSFGLHDVVGNVWEWCLDGHELYKHLQPGWTGAEPAWEGSSSRVLRGSSYMHTAEQARSASRGDGFPDLREQTVGLRPARSLVDPER